MTDGSDAHVPQIFSGQRGQEGFVDVVVLEVSRIPR
jgi:hypothetical protein